MTAIVDADGKIAASIRGLDQASGTFDPASSPATGGYQLIKGDDAKKLSEYSEAELRKKLNDDNTSDASYKQIKKELERRGLRADAVDWTEKKRFGNRFTILEGHGRFAGKFIVKGEGTNKTVNSYAEVYDLVQELLKW